MDRLNRIVPIPVIGWQCPNCGKAHPPDVKTCPEPPKAADIADGGNIQLQIFPTSAFERLVRDGEGRN